MATPRSTFHPDEFAVILDYDYETPPMGGSFREGIWTGSISAETESN
jgi:hypothetical protein